MLVLRCVVLRWYVYLWQHILSEPDEIMTMTGQKLPLKCSVDYISFSAHTDYKQTSEFLRALKPTHVVSAYLKAKKARSKVLTYRFIRFCVYKLLCFYEKVS